MKIMKISVMIAGELIDIRIGYKSKAMPLHRSVLWLYRIP